MHFLHTSLSEVANACTQNSFTLLANTVFFYSGFYYMHSTSLVAKMMCFVRFFINSSKQKGISRMTVADSLQYNATFANIWRHIGKIFAQNFVVYRIMAAPLE